MTTMESVEHAFREYGRTDPTHDSQLVVHVAGEPVLDLVQGPAMQPDSLLPVYSSSKGATAVVIGLLVQQGRLDLDATVATYWPEFAAAGKASITVRQLLSHQAGLPGVDGGFTWDETLDHAPLAQRLAAQRPFWQPARAFMYHAVTIGALADELVRRIDGRSVGDVLRDDVAGPRGIDVWMGTPESQDRRVLDAQAPTGEELTAFVAEQPEFFAPGDDLLSLALPTGDLLQMLHLVNQPRFRRAGQPAAGMLASARGLSALYAALHHEVGGQPRVLTDDTIAQLAQIQVAGPELGSGLDVRFGILFQVPCPPRWAFGSRRAFGHDGAGGSLAFSDPTFDMTFAYTVRRLPLPGGMDARAVELARLVRRALR